MCVYAVGNLPRRWFTGAERIRFQVIVKLYFNNQNIVKINKDGAISLAASTVFIYFN